MDVLQRLEELKEQNHMSDYRLGKECGLSDGTISNIFKRHAMPHIDTLSAICSGFGITLSQFFQEDEQSYLLTPEQKEMFDQWLALSNDKKRLVQEFIQLLGKANKES